MQVERINKAANARPGKPMGCIQSSSGNQSSMDYAKSIIASNDVRDLFIFFVFVFNVQSIIQYGMRDLNPTVHVNCS